MAATLCALAVVACVIPLALVQVPDAIAWSLPPALASQGAAIVASLLRTSSLALPAMAMAVPFAALAVRRLRAAPVLLVGLLLIGAADVLGSAARTVAMIGIDRALHGLGAGIALAAAAAVAAETRLPAVRHELETPAGTRASQARTPQQAASPRRALACWWAAVTVIGLAAAPAVMRERVVSAGWHAALQPYPWLTGIALALAALYAVLAEGIRSPVSRSSFPPAERARLALFAAPVAGLSGIAVAVSYQGQAAVIAASVADVIALSGLAATAVRGAAGRFAIVCAVAGFTVAPAAGVVISLTQPTAGTGIAAGIAALAGASLALLPRGPRLTTGRGLLLAAAGFALWYVGGTPGPLLPAAAVLVSAGLAAALTFSLRRTTGITGILSGLVILLAGVVSGYLAAGAVQQRALAGARTEIELRNSLVAAAGHWALASAAIAGIIALFLAFSSRRRRRKDQRQPTEPRPAAAA